MIKNGDTVKIILAKTFILLSLTGTLISKNPINAYKENIVYAATDLSSVKKDAINELKSIYKKFKKSYYSSKNYNKLTKYYNKAVNLINNAKSIEKIESYLETYKAKLESIKPTKLIKYQNKMEKKLLKTYKALISKNNYSDNNLQKIEDIKDEGLDKIHSALTKTKSKSAKNSYINKLKEVKTLIQQVKEDAYKYINNNKKISEEEKNVLINQIDNMSNEDNITALLEEYGYKYEDEYVETNPNKLTLDILNDEEKFNDFISKFEEKFSQIGSGYYYSIKNNATFYGYDSYVYMAFMLNYQYVDPKRSSDYLNKTTNSDVEQATAYLDMYIGIIEQVHRLGVIFDYDSLIIEDNEMKGVGKLLNKMQEYYNKNDMDKFSELAVKFYDKYYGKNVIIDDIAREIINLYILPLSKEEWQKLAFYEDFHNQLLSPNKTDEIYNTYFLDNYKNNKVKTESIE